MGRIVVTEFVSLDGVMEDPGGSEDFKYGGWSFEFARGDEGDKFKLDEALDAEALLLGRVTYEGFAAAWPSRERRVRGQVQQHAQVRRLLDPGRPGMEQLDRDHGDVPEQCEAEARIDGDIVVHGSAQLVQALLEHDLVDELRLMVFPVVLGSGKRVFGETSDKKTLELADSKTVGDGVGSYPPAGGRSDVTEALLVTSRVPDWPRRAAMLVAGVGQAPQIPVEKSEGDPR